MCRKTYKVEQMYGDDLNVYLNKRIDLWWIKNVYYI